MPNEVNINNIMKNNLTDISKAYFTTKKIVGRSMYEPLTLTRWLGRYLTEIESLFGERDKSYTVLGIELLPDTGTSPHTWFPPSCDNFKHVIIHLSETALKGEEYAKWQLAHECVHLIEPVTRGTSNLEEGMATWFQNVAVPHWKNQRENQYTKPWQLVKIIQEKYPSAIKTIREKHKMPLSKPQPDIMQNYLPEMSPEDISFLCANFE